MSTDNLFYSQLSITLIGIVFTGVLIIVQPNNLNVYLPIFSSLLFSWLPSPISTKNIQTDIKSFEEKLSIMQQKLDKKNTEEDSLV